MYILIWLLFLRLCDAVLEDRAGHDRFSFFGDLNFNSKLKNQHEGFMSFVTVMILEPKRSYKIIANACLAS